MKTWKLFKCPREGKNWIKREEKKIIKIILNWPSSSEKFIMRSQVSNTAIITPVSNNSPQPPVRRRRAQSVQAVQGISRIHDSEPRRVSLFESNVSWFTSSLLYESSDYNYAICLQPRKFLRESLLGLF